MVNYLRETLKNHAFSSSEIEEILSYFHLIDENKQTKHLLDEILCAYNEDINCDCQPLDEKNVQISKILQIHLFSVRLVSVLCLSKKMEERFRERKIDEGIIYQTMEDFRAKTRETYATFKVVGVLDWSWFFGFFRVTRFGLGRLQFELTKFRLPSYEKEGKCLTQESTVINVHSPRLEMPFTPEECEKSYQAAKLFFACHFKDGVIPFVCWSWLLYPYNKEILPPTSNVVKFLSRYDIIQVEEYTQENSPVSRIVFNCEHFDDLSTLPTDTSMRRRYAQFLQQGGKTGWGYGVFFLEDS